MCVSWGKNSLFFEKIGVLCFLETPVLKLTQPTFNCLKSTIKTLEKAIF